ncbi:MAG: hypothetical protein HY719_17800 [Planctomycetes bacterium]|nr:hypothetical protein [Planctomycetota bacterium]
MKRFVCLTLLLVAAVGFAPGCGMFEEDRSGAADAADDSSGSTAKSDGNGAKAATKKDDAKAAAPASPWGAKGGAAVAAATAATPPKEPEPIFVCTAEPQCKDGEGRLVVDTGNPAGTLKVDGNVVPGKDGKFDVVGAAMDLPIEVTAPGYLPWKATLPLLSKTRLKIVPNLEKVK